MDCTNRIKDEYPFIQIKSLRVAYSDKGEQIEAVSDVNLEIAKGEFAVIIGPSGCGKSTLLYALAGLIKPDAGEILLDGKPVDEVRKDTALILQDFGLLAWKTVEQNAILGLKIRGFSKKQAKEIIRKKLKDLEIEEMALRYPAQLSGGQRQRVAIARALALEPRLLLMDEPFSSLDALTRENLQSNLLEIWEANRINILLVTHSIEEAVFLGQKIFVMSKVPGTIDKLVENPLAGDISYRGKKQFHDVCDYLRSLLQ